MQKLLISLSLCATLFIAGCSVHKLEIQQGNLVTADALEQLQIGMTRKQVKFLLGTPLIQDPFHHDRWDYLYTLKISRQPLQRQRLTLYFEGDTLSRIEKEGLDQPQNSQ